LSFEDFRSEYSESEFGNPSSVFHEFSYLERMQDALASPIRIFMSSSSNGDPRMALAMFSRQDHRGLTLAPFTPYNPIWSGAKHSKDIGEGFDSVFSKVLQTSGRHHCHIGPQWKIENGFGNSFPHDEFYTYHIDLDGGSWRDTYSKSLSRILKKGREDVLVQVDNQQSSAVCDFVAASYKRSGRNLPLSLGAMKELAASMTTLGLADVYVAREKSSDEIKSGVICLSNSKRAHYWMAGGSKGAWMTLLIDSILESLSKQSVASFDFLGANNASIAEFKRRFGGAKVSYQGFHSNVGVRAKIKATISDIVKK